MSRTETRPDAAPPPAPPAPEGPLGGPPSGGRAPGAPFWAFPALLLLGLLLAGAVLLWTWQRDRTQDAAVAGANRAAATAQAQQDAQATASVTARGAAATATVAAIQTAIPGVPEFTVERVELPGSPLYDELRAAERRYWETYGDSLSDLNTQRIQEVASGEQLRRLTGVIEELRMRRYVGTPRFSHFSYIFNANGSKAFIYDTVIDRTVLLDATTRQPIDVADFDPAVGIKGNYVYSYERIGGTWKVTDSFKVVDTQPSAGVTRGGT